MINEQPEEPSASQRILGKLKENSDSLHISRIPKQTKRDFMALAEEEFCGDYGMVIKWFMDTGPIMAVMENHEARITSLENVKLIPEKQEKKAIKKLDGSKIEKEVEE